MGTSYSAAIVVGLEWDSLSEEKAKEITALVDDGTLGDYPPYYDGCYAGVFGVAYVITEAFNFDEIDLQDNFLEAAKSQFKEFTGLEAKIYLTVIGG